MNRESSRSHAVFTVALESKVGEFNVYYIDLHPPRLRFGSGNMEGTVLVKLSFAVLKRSLSSQREFSNEWSLLVIVKYSTTHY